MLLSEPYLFGRESELSGQRIGKISNQTMYIPEMVQQCFFKHTFLNNKKTCM